LRPSQLRAAAAEAARLVIDAAALAPRVAQIAAPALVLTGDGDRIVDPDHQSAWLASTLPGASLVRFEGAGHMLHHTAPEEVALAIEGLSASAVPVMESAADAHIH
jgi:pimeloyl-ACP methyl ester carboxylesterase